MGCQYKRLLPDVQSLPFARDLCITFPFAQFLRLPVRCLSACGHAQAGTQTGQAQILILEISNIFLWLKSSPFLNLNKIEHSAKVSAYPHPQRKPVAMHASYQWCIYATFQPNPRL